MEKISFCIASAKNEKYYTLGLLKSLKENTNFSNHEVLIFIDSDNQNTYKALLEQKQKYPNIKIYKNESEFPIGSQRNVSIMFAQATNDIVIYLQSDMVVGPEFDFYFLKDLNNNKNVILSAARVEPPLHPASPEKIVTDFGLTPENFNYTEFYDLVKKVQKENRPLIKTHFAPFGLFKETYFNVMGGFDTRFRCSREDSDFMLRLKANNLEPLQTWNAMVYHYTCVSSRGTDWHKNDMSSDIKNQWQTRADKEEVKRFIRKWGYFGHKYKPKYDTALILDINTAPDLNFLIQIEPYFNKLILNDKIILNQLINLVEYEGSYFSNKRWNYSSSHWNQVKNSFMVDNIRDRIILKENYLSSDVVIEADYFSLVNNLNEENNNFITHSNDILHNLLSNDYENYKGEYKIGNFKIKVNMLKDINEEHLDSKQYHLLLDLNKFKFK